MTQASVARSARWMFATAGALALASVLVHATADNVLEIVIVGGPHAGTYKPPDVICLHAKAQRQFTVAFKDFDVRADAIEEAGMTISNPDETGPRRGEVLVAFGSPGKTHDVYHIEIPRDAPGGLTLTKPSRGAELSFQGQTKNGVRLKLFARCLDVEEL